MNRARLSAVHGLIALLFLFITPHLSLAQTTGIAGVVRDTSGGVLPGVTVEASSPALIEKVRTAVTDTQGLYRIVDLRPGVYTVTFSLPGFTTVKRDGIELPASFTATVNADLTVGGVQESITVTGQNPTVDTHNVVQQRVLNEEIREALPTARSLQTMAAATIPGMVATATNRPSGQDVGGTSGERGQVMIHGSRPGDMTIQLDGLSWNLALAQGAAQGFTLNPAEAQEFVYETGAIAAETMTGGVRANVIPKEGGNRFNGSFFGSYTSGDLQSNNLTDALRAQGLQSANPIEALYDWNLSAGGPVRQDKLWFFASFRYWGQREQVTGMFRPIDPLSFTFNPRLGAAGNVDLSRPAIYDSWVRSYSLRLTWQATEKHKFSVYGAHQPRTQNPQAVSGTRSFEAAMLSPSKLGRMIQASWKAPLTSRLLAEAAFASPYNSTPEHATAPWITPDTISVTDIGTGLTYRAAPTYWVPYYYQPSAKAAISYVTGSHAAKFGLDVNWGSVLNDNQRTNGGMTYTLQNGVPRSITQILSPRNERERFRSVAFYAQDQWTIGRLTATGGVRVDTHTESVPVQQSGPGPFVPFQTWPEVEKVPDWRDVSPRVGVAYDLFGNGRTAVKATFSRYLVRDNTLFAFQNNPLLFNATATRVWTDANGDFITQESELGPPSNRNFGTAIPTTVVDDAIRDGWHVRPANWEFSTGVQHEILPQVSAQVAYFRRAYQNFFVTDNRAVTPADYDQFCITAPVDTRLPGGGGNQICSLYDLNPSKLGLVDNLRTSSDSYGTMKETFNGIDVSVNLRLPHRSQITGGLSKGTSFNVGNSLTNSTESCFVIDSPAKLRLDNPPILPPSGPTGTTSPQGYCAVNVPWLTQVKLMGTVGLPAGIDFGATFQSTPGPEIQANYTVNSSQVIGLGRNLTSGTATIALIEPATVFGDRIYQLDIRATKAFRYRGVRFRGLLDIGNVLNASTVLLQNNTYGPNWLRPAFIIPGRLFKPSVQIDF
jgi:hypothetical protein